MIRGTTPTYEFTIDGNVDVIKDIEVTFSQVVNSKTISVQKELLRGEIELGEGVATLKLTEDDTFGFSVGTVQVQMRILSEDGNIAASNIVKLKVEQSLSSDRLTEGATE